MCLSLLAESLLLFLFCHICLSLSEMVISLPFDLTGRYSNGAIDSLMVANFIQSVMNGISLFFPKHYEAIFR